MITLNREDYRQKVLGCWLGKNIGGTLGAPFEWMRQVNNVSFYTQDLGGEPLPNDDLDIQLIWLLALEERGVDVTAHTLADYWCFYVTPHWSEYGTAKVNMRSGLLPPLSGSADNVMKHSCGAFIRAEIWACIAPGQPRLAARYAYEDAILDHGDGEGTHAAVFIAALESAAFVMKDLRRLIDIGLSYIPADCGVAQAVRTAIECVEAGRSWREARNLILERHRGVWPWLDARRLSEEDRQREFHKGQLGYDAPSNIAMLILALLTGGDDFGQVVCTAVNCGEDTDCTAATAGSIWGILHGASAIPHKWIEPIGRKIKTISLNLGDLWLGAKLPQTVDELTDRTERMAMAVLLRDRGSAVRITPDAPTDLSKLDPATLSSPRPFSADIRGPRFVFDFFTVELDYGPDATIRDGDSRSIVVTIHNRYHIQTNLSLHWYAPEGWTITPADGRMMSFPGGYGPPPRLSFQVTAPPTVRRAINRAVLEITAEGRPTVMLVPLALINGNLAGKADG